ncbi:LSU ribosomal protein L30P [Winogradskyella thalassocola]|uniref:Large ribosomal subunit protein uL30 n=2 Tax=Flavobacteriaceae TaxID=49546 RepID=A0A1G8I4E3_9FLAO|nr:LSU ribosomal protein L30P [Winogradskyella thalassocola]
MEFHLKKYLTDNQDKMAKIKVTKVKSAINRTKRQKLTLEALGLNKIGQVKEHEATSSILGMVRKVEHLVSVEEA